MPDTPEPTPFDAFDDAARQIDAWEAKQLRGAGDTPLSRGDARNWLLPILRQLVKAAEEGLGAALDTAEAVGDELGPRVEDARLLAHVAAWPVRQSAAIVELLAQVHDLCVRVLSADLGADTAALATALRDATRAHAESEAAVRAEPAGPSGAGDGAVAPRAPSGPADAAAA